MVSTTQDYSHTQTIKHKALEVGVWALALTLLGVMINATTSRNLEKFADAQHSEPQSQENVTPSVAPVVEKKTAQLKKTASNSFPIVMPVFNVADGTVVRMNSDENCMALNAYFDNRNRTDKTMEYSMWTLRSRVGRYHNQTVCDAASNAMYDEKGNIVPVTAHYSWLADGKQNMTIGQSTADMQRWIKAKAIAKVVAHLPDDKDPTQGATHYHATTKTLPNGKKVKVDPAWAHAKDMSFLYEFDGNRWYRGW
jgi:hypothetical protein